MNLSFNTSGNTEKTERQKLPQDMCSLRKGVLKHVAKFTQKKHFQDKPSTLLKRRLFPVNFAKYLRTPFL